MMEKTVADIMVRDVVVVEKDAPVSYVARRMSEENIGSVVVVKGDDVTGIVTERDLVRKVTGKGKNPNSMGVYEIMTSPVISITSDTPVSSASRLMDENGIKKLPVVDDGKLVGIVTEVDMASALREELFSIEPALENGVAEGEGVCVLEPGSMYLIKEDKMSKSLDLFRDVVMQGVPGLCITRRAPNKIKDSHSLEKTPIIWLTGVKSQHKSINPQAFTELSLLISKFLKDAERAVILLDGIEYLITQNNYTQVLKLVQSLRDKVSTTNSHLIIPVCESALDIKELKLLEQEMDVILDDLNGIRRQVEDMEGGQVKN